MRARWIVIAYLIGALSFGVWGYADTITKALIGKEDIDLTQTDGGATETFSRATSTGATISLTKLEGNAIPWSNLYSGIVRPKSVIGNDGGNISGFDNITATSDLLSSGTLTVTGAATLSSTLGVTGAATFSSSVTSDSLATGTGSFTGDVAFGGDLDGDGASSVTGMVSYDLDTITIDTGTAAPTSGTWVAGDFVLNSAPTARSTIAATSAIGWVCITGGTPGTWQAVFPVLTATPDNAAMTCTAGMVAVDASYAYFCQAADTWFRVGIATW